MNALRVDIVSFCALLRPAEKRSREMRECAKRRNSITVYDTNDCETSFANIGTTTTSATTAVAIADAGVQCALCALCANVGVDCESESMIDGVSCDSMDATDRDVRDILKEQRELMRYEDFSNDSYSLYNKVYVLCNICMSTIKYIIQCYRYVPSVTLFSSSSSSLSSL